MYKHVKHRNIKDRRVIINTEKKYIKTSKPTFKMQTANPNKWTYLLNYLCNLAHYRVWPRMYGHNHFYKVWWRSMKNVWVRERAKIWQSCDGAMDGKGHYNGVPRLRSGPLNWGACRWALPRVQSGTDNNYFQLLFISCKFVKGFLATTFLLLVISSWKFHNRCQRFLI